MISKNIETIFKKRLRKFTTPRSRALKLDFFSLSNLYSQDQAETGRTNELCTVTK